MAGFTVKLEGLDELIAKLDTNKFKLDIRDELDTFGKAVVREAKGLAPKDEGALVNAIGSEMTTDSRLEFFCNIDYAAYMEFGTRKFAAAYVATLPADWQTLAAQYKGPGGGTFHDMVVAITNWVLRKGFSADVTKSGNASKSASSLEGQYRAAYLIAKLILINGVKPHPFFYPAFEKEAPNLIKNLQNLLK